MSRLEARTRERRRKRAVLCFRGALHFAQRINRMKPPRGSAWHRALLVGLGLILSLRDEWVRHPWLTRRDRRGPSGLAGNGSAAGKGGSAGAGDSRHGRRGPGWAGGAGGNVRCPCGMYGGYTELFLRRHGRRPGPLPGTDGAGAPAENNVDAAELPLAGLFAACPMDGAAPRTTLPPVATTPLLRLGHARHVRRSLLRGRLLPGGRGQKADASLCFTLKIKLGVFR